MPLMAPGIIIPRTAIMRRQITGSDTVNLTTLPTLVVPLRIQTYANAHARSRQPNTGQDIVLKPDVVPVVFIVLAQRELAASVSPVMPLNLKLMKNMRMTHANTAA